MTAPSDKLRDQESAERIKADHLAFAMLGHAAVIRNARERDLLAWHSPQPGCVPFVRRTADEKCKHCGGVGVGYRLSGYKIICEECACVSYLVFDVPETQLNKGATDEKFEYEVTTEKADGHDAAAVGRNARRR